MTPWWFALLIAMAATSAAAQQQTTLGPCSPAIGNVGGNVNVTCISGENRIRIAKYEGSVDADKGRKLAAFLEANFGQIIHIDASTDMESKLYQKDGGYLHIRSAPSCRRSFCPDGTEVFFNELDKPSTAYFAHGAWNFRGYYIVGCGGYGTGLIDYCLRPVDDKEVLFSNKYETR